MFFPWDFLVGHESPSERWGSSRAHKISAPSKPTGEALARCDSLTRSSSPRPLLTGNDMQTLSEETSGSREYPLRPIADVRPPANPYCGGGMPHRHAFSGIALEDTMAFLHIARRPASFIHEVGEVYHAPEFDGRPLHLAQDAGDNLCGYYSLIAALHSIGHPLIERDSFLGDCAAARRAQYAEMQIAPGTHDEQTSFVCAYDLAAFLDRHFQRNKLAAEATEIYNPTHVFFFHRQHAANVTRPNPPASWLIRHYNQVRKAQALLLMRDAHWTAFVRKSPGIWTHIDSFNAHSQNREYAFDSALDAVMAYAATLKTRNRYAAAVKSIETMIAISEP